MLWKIFKSNGSGTGGWRIELYSERGLGPESGETKSGQCYGSESHRNGATETAEAK